MVIKGLSKPAKSDVGHTHLISTINVPLLVNQYKGEAGGWAKKPKNRWDKICVKCGDAFSVDNKKDTAVRKCNKCKYD